MMGRAAEEGFAGVVNAAIGVDQASLEDQDCFVAVVMVGEGGVGGDTHKADIRAKGGGPAWKVQKFDARPGRGFPRAIDTGEEALQGLSANV